MGGAVKGGIVVWALLLGLLLAPLSVHAQETTIIQGRVENGTAGADLPQDLEVTLDVFRLGESVETREAVADGSGLFSFDGVPGGTGFGYIISAQHAGALYVFESDYPLPSEPVTLMVYESTSSSEAVRTTTHTLVISMADSDTRLMTALELVGLENTGDRTFVPDLAQAEGMDLLRFSLPPSTTELDVQSSLRGGQILQVEMGFAMTTPVPPGTYEIAYTYVSAYRGNETMFTYTFPFGAETFRFLIPQELGQAKGTGLQDMGSLSLDRLYRHLEAEDLPRGATVTLELSGLPQPALWQRWQSTVSGESFVKAAIPAAFELGLLALLGYVFLRGRQPQTAMAGSPSGPGQRPPLIEAIARLDDRFQRRELGKEEYLRRRREMKAEVLGTEELLPRTEEQPGPGGARPPSEPEHREERGS